MASIVATTDIATATVRLDIDNNVLRDTFTRTVVSGWGSADTGQAYSTPNGGVAGDYNVNGGLGRITNNTTNVNREAMLTTVSMLDGDVTWTAAVSQVATGASIVNSLYARRVDGNNLYRFNVNFGLSGLLLIQISRTVGGVSTTIATANLTDTYSAGTLVNVRSYFVGTTFKMKVWLASVVEPAAWNLQVNDYALMTAGSLVFRAQAATGNTNVAPESRFDNVNASVSNEGITVNRVYPDGTVREIPGSPMVPSSNLIVAYDTAAPLQTSIFYQFLATGGSELYTSNSVQLATGTSGWLKDILVPTNNVLIDNCTVHTPNCLSTDQMVFFQRLDTEGFSTASGLFPIVDNSRPHDVAQLRKDVDSVLYVISRRHEDITVLERLFAPGRVLLLQLPTVYGWALNAWGSNYIRIGDISKSRIAQVEMRKPYRAWALPFSVIDEPEYLTTGNVGGNVPGVPGATYGDLFNSGMTYQGLVNTGNTYQDTAQGDNF